MNAITDTRSQLTTAAALLYGALAVGAFHLAYTFDALSPAIALYLFALVQLARVNGRRKAFYGGLAVGFAVYGPQLAFFWNLFGATAVALWLVLAFWIGAFVLLAHLCFQQFGRVTCLVLIPFLWTGLEYFRSELYYLRFSWLNVGYVFSNLPSFSALMKAGVYSAGWLLMLGICGLALLPRRAAALTGTTALLAATLPLLLIAPPGPPVNPAQTEHAPVARVVGMQMEFPAERDVLTALDELLDKFPDAEVLVLSEYTFDGPIPAAVTEWCRKHQRFLIAGGKEFGSDAVFVNTAFVIGPDGDIVFRQAKSVPIQFFDDGLPARERRLWNSPWGKVAIAICYDLSYRRVMDDFVRQGAQAIIVPAMDVAEWGKHQHELHARVALVRAMEYGVPIFRLCSSGISQHVAPGGRLLAVAPFPGEREVISGLLHLGRRGTVPLDHWLAPVATAVTIAVACWLIAMEFWKKRRSGA